MGNRDLTMIWIVWREVQREWQKNAIGTISLDVEKRWWITGNTVNMVMRGG